MNTELYTVPGEDGRHPDAAVHLDDAPRALEVQSVQHSLQGLEQAVCHPLPLQPELFE